MIKLEIPRTILLPKEPKRDRNSSFMITYEYSWSKSMEAADAPSYMLQQNKSNGLDSLPNDFSATISFSFQHVRRIRDDCT